MSIGWQVLHIYRSVVFCIHVCEENSYESIPRHNFGLYVSTKRMRARIRSKQRGHRTLMMHLYHLQP